MSEVVIRADKVRKTYRKYRSNFQKIQHMLFLSGSSERVKVLRGISFEIRRGEKVCIISGKGQGKSTLMSVLAGIYTPESGSVTVNGRVTRLFDNKLGFQTALTGRDNYEVLAMLLGWTKEQTRSRMEEIFRFAGIWSVRNQPIRLYDKGRAALMGFAAFTADKPDILLVDEKFGFGGKKNSRKAIDRLEALISAPDVTYVMALNTEEIAERLCERGIVIHEGKLVFDGPIEEALEYYRANCRRRKKPEAAEPETSPEEEDSDGMEL